MVERYRLDGLVSDSKFSLELLPDPNAKLQNATMLGVDGLMWVTTGSDDDRKGTLVFKAAVSGDDYDRVTAAVPKFHAGPRRGKTGPPAAIKYTCGCEVRDVLASGTHKATTDVDASHCEHGHKVNLPVSDSPNAGVDEPAMRAVMVAKFAEEKGVSQAMAERLADRFLAK